MINVSHIFNFGVVDLFMLPGFRERTFPGQKGRLRFPIVVDTGRPIFESSAKTRRIDWALRYSHTIGAIDLGISHFWGTSRDPRFVPSINIDDQTSLRPRYDVIHQSGVDSQLTLGAFLGKLEWIHRIGSGHRYWAATVGTEVTFSNIGRSGLDLGLVSEYLFDSRGDDDPNPFGNRALSPV